jgi:autotransporter-associated beta strand protein
MTGGTLNSTTYITIGRRGGATGHFNVSGGNVNQTGEGAGLIVGENGTGTLTVSGTGVLDINGGGLYLSAEAAGTSDSRVFLNGGTIIAKRVVQRDFNISNYTEFRFNGGILRAKAGANAEFMNNHDLVSVDAGGAFIDSNGQGIGISQPLGGTGSLTKQGAGTLTLSGANTYAGNTTVSAGTLSLTSAYLSNTSTVTIAAGAVLNLSYVGTDQVSGLTIGVTPLAVGIYDSTTHPGVITGTGKLQVTGSVASPYATWISGFPSIPVADRDPGDDPDNDGYNNAMEFALGSTPNSGSNRAKIYSLVADSSADGDTTNEMLMTIAVRSGTPAFIGSPSPTATHEGMTYSIEGGTTLSGFTIAALPVAVVAPPAPNATPPTGYEYRTFSLTGSNGMTGKGFLRVRVTY